MRGIRGEAWSVRLHAERRVLSMAGSFLILKRPAAILAAAVDEGRARSSRRQNALLHHAYLVADLAAASEGHGVGWG